MRQIDTQKSKERQ